MQVLLGIGNDLLGDDGVGPYIARNVSTNHWKAFDGGSVPENFIRPIRNLAPDLLVLVDAVDMGMSPGTVRIIPVEAIRDHGFGSHQISLAHLIGILESFCSRVVLVGVQPRCLDPDTPLTPPVISAADSILTLLKSGEISGIIEYAPGGDDHKK